MELNYDLLNVVAGRKVDHDNATSFLIGLALAPDAGLLLPQRLAMYGAQTMHESMAFTYDREIYNQAKPTAAQAKYDTRTGLGNTPEKDGDGYRNRGMGPMQLTGAGVRREFGEWLSHQGFNPPTFVENENLLADPWEGLSAVWFWLSRDLNRYADEGDIEMVSVRINGGRNGLDERIAYYARWAIAILGFDPGRNTVAAIETFQQDHGLKVDGIAGEKTRAAMHEALAARPPLTLPPEIIDAARFIVGDDTTTSGKTEASDLGALAAKVAQIDKRLAAVEKAWPAI